VILTMSFPIRRAAFVPRRMITLKTLSLLGMVSLLPFVATAAQASRPNVVLIMTDDQGSGDFGVAGNTVFETPHIDAMARRSATMTTFYVSPVCSPTRACLMTGRYNYRTRCIDTYIGRSMMDPDEVTIAEILQGAGYATGVFGKWHLGDCYPMRPIDQGFQEALVFRGGGLAQPSEPRENGNRYTDPILFHNGRQVQTHGYCTDVYFDAALQFIDAAHAAQKNFFAYVPTNVPHDPFHDVPPALLEHYQGKQDELAGLIIGQRTPEQRSREVDHLARIAAMITNVDQNIGRLFAKLDQLGITDNTLVLFLVDNGPNTRRYVGQRRGVKSDVHDGGIRSPLWLHWPARLPAGTTRDQLSAHIDVLPTVLDACGVAVPAGIALDGKSLLPLLDDAHVPWPDRTLVIQSHRGDQPVRYHHFMIRDQRWKLVHPSGFGRERFDGEPAFELYDLVQDPWESQNLIAEHPAVAQRLRQAYDRWFDDVSSSRPDNYAPPRIWIGTPHENPTVLTRQDWRADTWVGNAVGHWELQVAHAATYDLHVELDPLPEASRVAVELAGSRWEKDVEPNAASCEFAACQLPVGETRLEVRHTAGNLVRGAYQVTVARQK
jgi:arylsulfatase/arylsulfatase A